MSHQDVLVIGGGVIGSSIAYHLARQGQKVLVVERSAIAYAPAASWASAGGVRRQGRHAAEAPLAREAIARWPSLEAELDADLHYRQGGNILLAETDTEAEQLVQFVEQQRQMGFTDVYLVDRLGVRDLIPAIGDQVIAGSFSPADGQADPPLTTRAFAAAAQRLGATYWTHTACESLITSGDQVTGAHTAQGDVAADTVVLAAGAWSDDLAASVGLKLPFRTIVLQMLLSTPGPLGTLSPVIGSMGRALSLKQLLNGAFFIGGGWPGDAAPDRASATVRQTSVEGSWATACAVLPAVGQQCIAHAWCGLEAEPPDEIPLIGPAPNHPGLYLALGFSGHGFAIAPAVGRAVAAELTGQLAPELDGLRPSRFQM